MRRRSFFSVFIATIFLGLSLSGLYLMVSHSERWVILTHVILGLLFFIGAIAHLSNNWRSLMTYFRQTSIKLVAGGVILLISLMVTETFPFKSFNDSYARFKAGKKIITSSEMAVYQFDSEPNLSLEIRAGQHFWFPQVVVWKEDTAGKFLETLFITQSTARGEFLGGRTKENFKSFDSKRSKDLSNLRRVDALPYWSHSRGIKYEDGLFAPPPNQPMPDGITGATPNGNFKLTTKTTEDSPFRLLLELNVAFDDNKYYSVYDYPDDSLYHSDTGLLGQPSVVYEVVVSTKAQKYYIMEYIGHTFPTGGNGELYYDKNGLTTALQIIDLALANFFTPPPSTTLR